MDPHLPKAPVETLKVADPPPIRPQRSARSLLLGGVLPVVVYTVIESYGGILWGLVAGMTLGVGEIVWEYYSQRKVDTITLLGNGLLLVLGGVSLFTQEGFWFKMQPALMEAVFALILIGSVLIGKPFLILMAQKQQMFARMPPAAIEIFKVRFRGMTFRMGIFFGLHAALATHAAYRWTTSQWALLKGVGFTVSFIIYMLIEVVLLRR